MCGLSRRLGAGVLAATLGAMVFALAPVQIEAVAWVSGRTDLMAALFVGLAALALASPSPVTVARALAIFVFSTAAGLCKENALLVMPVVGLGVRSDTGRFSFRVFLPVLLAMAVVLVFRIRALGGLGQGALLDVGSRFARLGVQISLALGFDPRALMSVPTAGAGRFGAVALVPVSLVLVVGAAARLWQGHLWLAAGLLVAALLALLPVAGLRMPALRYWYLSMLCLAPVLALGLERLLWRYRARMVLVPVGLLLGMWTLFGQLRLPAWRSGASLFAAEVDLQPENPDALFFHAQRTALDGRPDRAVPVFEAALKHDPGHRPSWLGLGRALLSLGQAGAAENVARQSLRGEPRTWPQFLLLGDALARQKKWEQAAAVYDDALGAAPQIPDVLVAAARAARETGHPARAQELARRALLIDPQDRRALSLAGAR